MTKQSRSDAEKRRFTSLSNLEKAIKTWLEYEDSDRFDEEKSRELIKARIEIREALRKGYRLVDLKKLDKRLTNYESGCLVKKYNDEECLRCTKKVFAEVRKIIQEPKE
jgi:HEPN domain-containing protein